MNHEFVEYVPDALEDGVVYVCINFATAVHKCCCGCGFEVVTPISPTDWQVTYDGQSVSLDPSIGNWSFQCQSHYWIRNNAVIWARAWSKQEIELGRRRDAMSKHEQFSRPGALPGTVQSSGKATDPVAGRIRKWLTAWLG